MKRFWVFGFFILTMPRGLHSVGNIKLLTWAEFFVCLVGFGKELYLES